MVVHTCNRCEKKFPKLWKLRRHLERQYQCHQKNIPIVNQPAPEPQVVIPTPIPEPEPQIITPTLVPETEFQKEVPVLGRDYITEEEAKNWVNPNTRRPKEHYKTWGKRLVQK